MKLRLCNNDMELALTGNENGWWIVSHESKLWLPNGELPSGTAAAPGCRATWRAPSVNGRAPVWLVRRAMPREMGSVRQLLIRIAVCSSAGRAAGGFLPPYRYCGYCGHEMHLSRTESACLCGHCKERYYPQIAPCVIVAIRRDDQICWRNTCAIAAVSTRCWPASSKWAKRWSRRWRAK